MMKDEHCPNLVPKPNYLNVLSITKPKLKSIRMSAD